MNNVDLLFIMVGYLNIYLQFGPIKQTIERQIVMVACILMSLVKMFFFMRLFNQLTYIVNMITRVINDLKVFITFYMSFIFIGSLAFNLIGHSKQYKYSNVGSIAGTFLINLQLTVGNFDLTALTDNAKDLEDWKHFLFWFIWYCYVIFGQVIILNFIIAEVGNSYQVIKEDIDAYVQKERASMI